MTGPSASRGGRYEPNSYLSRPGSSYVLDTRNLHAQTHSSSQQSHEAAMGGDVLANEALSTDTQTPVGRWQFS